MNIFTSQTVDEEPFFYDLPLHIIFRILKYLDEKSLTIFSMCSKFTKKLSQINLLWENIYNRKINLDYLCVDCAQACLAKNSSNPENKINYKSLCVEGFLKHKFWCSDIEKEISLRKLQNKWAPTRICLYNSFIFAYVGLANRLYVYSLKHSEEVIHLTTPHREIIISMINTKYGIVCGSLDGLVSLWSFREEGVIFSNVCNIIYQHDSAVYALSSHNAVLVSGSDDYTACIFDMENLYLVRKISYTNRIRKTVVTEKWILIAGLHGSIHAINIVSHEEFTLVNSKSSVVGMWVNQDSFISISRDDKIKVWNLTDRFLKLTIPTKLKHKMFYNLVKFVTNDIALIRDKIEGVRIICLKKYHCIHLFEQKNDKIKNFEVIDKYMIALEVTKKISLWDLKERRKIKILFEADIFFSKMLYVRIMIYDHHLFVYGCRSRIGPASFLYVLNMYRYISVHDRIDSNS